MSEAAMEARTWLWECLSELDEHDAEHGWRFGEWDAALLACERVGLLPPDELDAFRALADGADVRPAGGDRAAVERHLETLARDLRPMSRTPDDEAFAASQRFHDAMTALESVGLLTGERLAEWRGRAFAVEVPSADDAEREAHAAGHGSALVRIPAETPEQEAEEAAFASHFETLQLRGDLVRVLPAARIDRHDGLAIVAVIARTESTEVHFHHVGGPTGDDDTGFEAFHEINDTLVAPALADDAGTIYEPVWDRPVSASSPGGVPDPDRLRVTTGVWRYQPPAPAEAQRFTASLGDATWTIP